MKTLPPSAKPLAKPDIIDGGQFAAADKADALISAPVCAVSANESETAITVEAAQSAVRRWRPNLMSLFLTPRMRWSLAMLALKRKNFAACDTMRTVSRPPPLWSFFLWGFRRWTLAPPGLDTSRCEQRGEAAHAAMEDATGEALKILFNWRALAWKAQTADEPVWCAIAGSGRCDWFQAAVPKRRWGRVRNARRSTALIIAAETADAKEIERFLAFSDANAKGLFNWTALNAAAAAGNADAIDPLWRETEDREHRTVHDDTPFLAAARSNNPEAMRALILLGCDANAVGRDGRALACAVRSHAVECVKALLEMPDSEYPKTQEEIAAAKAAIETTLAYKQSPFGAYANDPKVGWLVEMRGAFEVHEAREEQKALLAEMASTQNPDAEGRPARPTRRV